MIGKTDFVLGQGLNRIQAQKIPQAQGQILLKSRGLLLVIGPFNFPFHLPFGQILPALVSGNTVLFKPSEKTPASGQKLAEIFHKINLPGGVFQMIQGGAKISKQLCLHKQTDGVLFTGSFEVGQKIKSALVKDYSKILVWKWGVKQRFDMGLQGSKTGCRGNTQRLFLVRRPKMLLHLSNSHSQKPVF